MRVTAGILPAFLLLLVPEWMGRVWQPTPLKVAVFENGTPFLMAKQPE